MSCACGKPLHLLSLSSDVHHPFLAELLSVLYSFMVMRNIGLAIGNLLVNVHLTKLNLSRIKELNDGQTPLTYQKFQSVVAKMELPPYPVPTLDLHHCGQTYFPLVENHDLMYGIPLIGESLPVA